jgi:membrane protein YdbS with pleckstrin-like domain
MLTEEEKEFIEYWQANREKKKKIRRQLSVGLPAAVLMVAAIFANLFSGWDKRAQMALSMDPSLILVLIVAAFLIVIFITIFSARHRWDLNEQRYREITGRSEES